MGWQKLGIGLFLVGALLISSSFVWDGLARPAPAPRIVAPSAAVKDCAAKFDSLASRGVTPTRARDVMHACDVAIISAPRNCSAFLAAAGRAGFTAEQGIGSGRPSDLEPYEASRRDAMASRGQCSV